MSTYQASSLRGTSHFQRRVIGASINVQKLGKSHISVPKFPTRVFLDALPNLRIGSKVPTITHIEQDQYSNSSFNVDPTVVAKLYAIMELVNDRMEMHKNIGEQRNNWNILLLTSINTMTLTAATLAAIASTIAASVSSPVVMLKLSSSLMYVMATGLLMVINKIQPSQLVEEQRNSTRLFKQLHVHIQTTLSVGNVSMVDVNEAMAKVLALDKAYPLPLLGTMLEKFPKTVEPAVWWPQHKKRSIREGGSKNGWNRKLEEEMREVVTVLKKKDSEDYLRLSKVALGVNKILAISGPLLTGLAAVGSLFLGSSCYGTLAATAGIVGGGLAIFVNTIEHGGQVGMVFEMYRSSAGFFKLMEESIEFNLNERDLNRRENGELLEMKVALQLGRSLSELKNLKSSSRNGESFEEFASKLF